MLQYKRNQIEEAISLAIDPKRERPPAELLNRMKRLLDSDRNLGRNPRSADPVSATFAFYSGEASGSGVEVWFRPCEAFALLIALKLLEHGFPQQKSVEVLRRLRAVLEGEHTRILALDPTLLFDREAIQKHAKPGQLYVGNTDPVYLVIASTAGAGSKDARVGPVSREKICRGDKNVVGFIKASGELSEVTTIVELVTPAHILNYYLSKTEPSQRGRSAR